MSLLWLNLLIIVPVIAYRVARYKVPQHLCSITGASVGVVIAPISLGLYSWYFVSIIGFVPGVIGLILSLIHETPGYYLALNLELIQVGKVVTGFKQLAIVEVLNSIVWLTCYGAIGYAIDCFRSRKK